MDFFFGTWEISLGMADCQVFQFPPNHTEYHFQAHLHTLSTDPFRPPAPLDGASDKYAWQAATGQYHFSTALHGSLLAVASLAESDDSQSAPSDAANKGRDDSDSQLPLAAFLFEAGGEQFKGEIQLAKGYKVGEDEIEVVMYHPRDDLYFRAVKMTTSV